MNVRTCDVNFMKKNDFLGTHSRWPIFQLLYPFSPFESRRACG